METKCSGGGRGKPGPSMRRGGSSQAGPVADIPLEMEAFYLRRFQFRRQLRLGEARVSGHCAEVDVVPGCDRRVEQVS